MKCFRNITVFSFHQARKIPLGYEKASLSYIIIIIKD